MKRQPRPLVVALAGNPNSGKTTIFNNFTGASQHVGNYPGVTVEKKEGTVVYKGHRIRFVDLPGTYSLSAFSIEEIIARNFIVQQRPDVVVNIVDGSNLERNLYLTTQIFELGTPVVIALNMLDTAASKGMEIDIKLLSQLLNVPVIPTVGSRNKGTDELFEAILETARNGLQSPALVNFGKEFEEELGIISKLIESDGSAVNGYRPRWLALKLLENDTEVAKSLSHHENVSHLVEATKESGSRLESLHGDDISSIVTDRRYGFVSGACSEAVRAVADKRHDISDSIDNILIHPTFGLPIFAALMWLMFHLTFTVGETPMGWIESGVVALSGLTASLLPDGVLQSLLCDGVIAGVGGVVSFLPNIILLFLCIAILEDSGYMARAAFVMDRLMHRIGLHGKSFIPMLIGFGCSVPAYMGCRILEDRTDRLVTMHVTTFMSCGARLPVYILVCGAFWPGNAGSVIFAIYGLGVIIAVGSVKLLRSTRFRGISSPFIMELPPYRVPTVKSLLIHMWERSWLYLRKAGTIILGVSIVIWALMNFPALPDSLSRAERQLQTAERQFVSGDMSSAQFKDVSARYEAAHAAEQIEYSVAGRVGKVIEPVIKPLGFDWRLGIAIFSGFAAKEVVVSTMGTVYGMGESDEESETLRSKLASDPEYSQLKAFSFLIFVLLYLPCLSALAVFLREAGDWRELVFQITYTTGLAWCLSFVVYQGGSLIGLG